MSRRLCPCRDYIKGQTALCKDCVDNRQQFPLQVNFQAHNMSVNCQIQSSFAYATRLNFTHDTDNLLRNHTSSIFANEVFVQTFVTNRSFQHTQNYLNKFLLLLQEVFCKIVLETYYELQRNIQSTTVTFTGQELTKYNGYLYRTRINRARHFVYGRLTELIFKPKDKKCEIHMSSSEFLVEYQSVCIY